MPVVLPLLLLAVLLVALPARAAFDFALVGDFPYTAREEAMAEKLIGDIRSQTELAWVLHLGDMRGSDIGDCSDAFYANRLQLYRKFGHPFVFTPGDNDWLDCAEPSVERLAALRRIFFDDAGNGLEQEVQARREGFAEFVENRRWQREGVMFATVHLLNPSFNPFIGAAADAAYRDQLRAAKAWLDETFAEAGRAGAKAVFIAMQADLWPLTGLPRAMRLTAPGGLQVMAPLRPFADALRQHVITFGRPVVVANGDTHYFRIDKPLFDANLNPIETFTRVESFGSPLSHWVRVSVDPERPEVFSFRQEIVEANVFTAQIPGQAPPPAYVPRHTPWLLEALAAARRAEPYLAVFGFACALLLLLRLLRRLLRRR